MGFRDLAESAQKTINLVHGDSADYQQTGGGPLVEDIKICFDENAVDVNPDLDITVSSSEHLGLAVLSDLPSGSPKRKDLITRDFDGKVFRVEDFKHDGYGNVYLKLHGND